MEKINLEEFPVSESAKAMLSYVSDGFYDRSYVGKWLFQAMGAEYDKAREAVLDLPAQFFPETATWGLEYHERKWGLPVCPVLPIEERRKRIFQKRDSVAPMTPHAMEGLLKTVTEFKTLVQDSHDDVFFKQKPYLGISHPNEFKVILEGEGDAEIAGIRRLLDQVKQSHTVYSLLYYKSYCFVVSIEYGNRTYVKLEFWPRPKNMGLLLDGRRRLDGSWRLNGYDLDKYVDYYSAKATAVCGVGMKAGASCARVLAKDRMDLAFPLIHANAVHVGQGLWMRPPGADHYPASVSASCGVGISVRSSAAHVVVDARLDGKWRLDGGRKLGGGPYAL